MWTKKPLVFYLHSPELFFYPIRKSIKLLKASQRLRKKRISLITPASLKEDLIQNFSLKNIRLFPDAPVPLTMPPKQEEFVNCGNFYLGYFGDARKEKNFNKVVALIDAAPAEIGFTVQCNPPGCGFYEAGIKEAIGHIKGVQRDRLLIFEKPLPQKEYRELLNKSSIVWCLYDKSYYKDRVSGILLEVWSLGKPVITTSGTWMAKQVEKYGGGIVLATLEVQDILKAIEKIRGDYARFSDEAETAGRILYEKNNGVALARFIKDIVRK